MELKLNVQDIPSIIYMQFETENGKTFVIFEDGKQLEDVKAISLYHNSTHYSLDLERDIGFI